MNHAEYPKEVEDPVFEIADLFSFLWQKKLRIIITILVICGVGFYYITKLPKIYRASATILLDTNSQNFSLPDPVATFSSSGDTQLETYMEFLRSRQFIEKIVDELSLTSLPEFRSKRENATEQRHLDFAVSQILYNLTITRLGETHLLKISYESLSPQIAADVANAVGPTFFEFQSEMSRKRADEATAWLTQHLSELQTELTAAETAFQSFLREESLVDISSQIALANREMSSLLEQKGINDKKIANMELTLQQITLANGDIAKLMSIPRFLNHPALGEIASKIAAQQIVFTEIKKRYKYKHHRYIAEKSNLEQLIAERKELIKQFIGAINQEFEGFKAHRESLRGQLEVAQAKLSEMARQELTLTKLRREVESTQKLYEAFLARLQETEILRDLGNNEEYAVIDVAPVPASPSKPRVTLMLAVLGLIATFFSIGFWLAMHFVSDRQTRFRQLIRKLDVPLLTEIPKISKGSRSAAGIVVEGEKDYLYAEAIRSLRTAIIVQSGHKEARIIAMTGIKVGAGKSSVAISLARSFGKLEKALLVDADLRFPSIHKVLKIDKNRPGLTDFINRKARFSDCLVKEKDSHLSVIPSGSVPNDPISYISTSRFSGILNKLGILYERLILEAPVLNDYSDALILSRYVDGVIVVCDAEHTDSVELVDAIHHLREAGAPLMGVVLNKVKNIRSNVPQTSNTRRFIKKILRPGSKI